MMKKFILAIATLSMLATLPSCTSKNSQNEDVIADDSTADDLAMSGGENLDESLDVETTEQTADATTSPDTSVADTTTDDQLTIDSFGEGSSSSDTTAMGETPVDPSQMSEPAPPTTTEPPSTDLAMEAPPTGAEEIAPPTETIPEQQTTQAETDLDQPKPVSRSLQKMAESPWKMGSKWVNGIYFARPGDSLDSISQTIYGEDRTSELKRINPTYKNRDVKPGDKVYYASVVRPDDSEKIVTYFEEKNIPSKSYVSKSGDNIRKVSQELLGYPEAWKEVWSYNTLTSKQGMDEGTELRYWDAQAHTGGAPSMPLADQATSAPTPPPMDMAPPPPMEDASMAQNELPPPPPDMGAQAGMNELPPPPPPPPMDMAPPPPPPPMEMAPPPPPPPVAQNNAPAEEGGSSEQDSTLAMAAVAVVALGAVALIMVRRKRKQREMDQALGETHVG